MSIPCEFKSFGCRVEIHFKDKEMVSWNVVICIDQRFLSFLSGKTKPYVIFSPDIRNAALFCNIRFSLLTDLCKQK